MAHRSLSILRRRLFTVLSVLSLLLCLATLALWVRSHKISEEWFRASNYEATFAFCTRPGGFELAWGDVWGSGALPSHEIRDGWCYLSCPAFPLDAPILSIRHVTQRHLFGRSKAWYVSLDFWLLALLFAILPALRLRAAIRDRKRLRIGRCRVCGYDLRATPDRCPECGAVNDQFPSPNDQSSPKPQ